MYWRSTWREKILGSPLCPALKSGTAHWATVGVISLYYPGVFPAHQGLACHRYHRATTPEPWAAALGIAAVAAKELAMPAAGGRKVRYIVSYEASSDKLVRVLGEAIGQLVQWLMVPHAALEEAYQGYGMRPDDCLGNCAQGTGVWRPRGARGVFAHLGKPVALAEGLAK